MTNETTTHSSFNFAGDRGRGQVFAKICTSLEEANEITSSTYNDVDSVEVFEFIDPRRDPVYIVMYRESK